jgi:hypothetical protein
VGVATSTQRLWRLRQADRGATADKESVARVHDDLHFDLNSKILDFVRSNCTPQLGAA